MTSDAKKLKAMERKKMLHVWVDEETFFKLVELKGRLKSRTWREFFRKIVGRFEESERI